MSGLARHDRRRRFQIDGELATKPTTDLAGNNFDLRDRDLQHVGHLSADIERTLGAHPNRYRAVVAPMHCRVVRFDISLVDCRRVEFPLHYYFRLSESRFYIAHFVAVVGGDVTLPAGVLSECFRGPILVQQRSVILHRLQDIDNGWQRLIFYFDKIQRFVGNVRVNGGHRSHGMTLVKHLFGRQRILRQLTDVDDRFPHRRQFIYRFHQVVRSRHGAHTFQFHRFVRIDRDDAGVSMGTAQDLTVKQARYAHVGPVDCASRHLIGTIVTDRTGPYDLIFSFTGEFGIRKKGISHD